MLGARLLVTDLAGGDTHPSARPHALLVHLLWLRIDSPRPDSILEQQLGA